MVDILAGNRLHGSRTAGLLSRQSGKLAQSSPERHREQVAQQLKVCVWHRTRGDRLKGEPILEVMRLQLNTCLDEASKQVRSHQLYHQSISRLPPETDSRRCGSKELFCPSSGLSQLLGLPGQGRGRGFSVCACPLAGASRLSSTAAEKRRLAPYGLNRTAQGLLPVCRVWVMLWAAWFTS
jgi:hypothetical protein